MECINCRKPISPAKRECQTCGADNGFPNVRLAQLTEETEALTRRLNTAEESARARGCDAVLRRFGNAVLASKAVIARPLGQLLTLLESETRNYTSFANELRAGARVPEENKFDGIRPQFESALFPNFHEDILFACLSLGGGPFA